MATANEEIRDQLIRHQIELFRFSKGLAGRIRALLNRAEPELRARLKARLERIAALGWDPGPATTKRMIATAKLIREINRATFQEINALIRKELVGLAIGETQFIAGVLSTSLPVIFEPLLPTPQTLAQTSMSAITNAARSALYARNRSIRREVFVATLDARTTPICQSLDGDVFPKNEGPFPPLHLNCRSLRAPIVDGRKLGRRPATAATERELRGLRGPARRRAVDRLTGPVPAETTYTQFLRRQTAGFQDDVLGPARGRLFRSGEIDLKGFVDNSGQRFTLRELYDQDAGAFQRAGVPAPPAPGALVPRNP